MKLFSSAKVLYTPGPLIEKQYPEIAAATKKVLKDIGVGFVLFPIMSGYEAWFAGHEKEFQLIMQKNKELLRKNKIREIISNDPHEVYTYKKRYNIEARHIIEVLKENSEKIKKGEERRANYHHPCFLDRLEISPANAKSVLRRAGIHTPPENRARGCCGSVGHDFSRNNPELAKSIANARLKELKEKKIYTCCPHCIKSLGRRRTKDVMEALAEALE